MAAIVIPGACVNANDVTKLMQIEFLDGAAGIRRESGSENTEELVQRAEADQKWELHFAHLVWPRRRH